MIRAVLAAVGLAFLAACATTPQVTPPVRAELAPTGKLRVGINFQNMLLTRKDPATGEAGGIALDLARELGQRVGVPVEIIAYDTAGKMAEAARTGAWDVAFLAVEPERANEIAFSVPYVENDATFLVPAGSPIRAIADVDREGVRIAVAAKGAPDLFLTRSLKRARLMRAPSVAAAFKQFVSDKLEALAGYRPVLIMRAEELRGSRVLDGRFSSVYQAIGMPRGRNAGVRYLNEFIEDAKTTGLVARLIEKNGVRGLTVAPPAGGSSLEIGGSM